MANREVLCLDAINWLKENKNLEYVSVVTSLPDFSEFSSKLSLSEWKTWFVEAARLSLEASSEDGVTIFYQTDIKQDGIWIDKGYLVQKAADELGHSLLWHKVICRTLPGHTTFGRPGFAHMLCFSKNLKHEVSKSTPDVLPEAGEVTWTRGMGTKACLSACKFILENSATKKVFDPFCGHGTVLAVANHLGLDAFGIDISPKCARKAETLTFAESQNGSLASDRPTQLG